MTDFECYRSDEGLSAFEELYLYACPKFISANIPPYQDISLLAAWVANPPVEPPVHHLNLFLREVSSKMPTRNLRSSLRLYASLDARKLAGFLDVDEEEMVCAMMVLKMNGRSVCRIGDEGAPAGTTHAGAASNGSSMGSFLDGQMITTSDFDFVITEVSSSGLLRCMISDVFFFHSLQNMIKTVETTVGRRYAGWFIRNGEYAQRVLDGLKNAPLPGPQAGKGAGPGKKGFKQSGGGHANQKANGTGTGTGGGGGTKLPSEKKVAWKV